MVHFCPSCEKVMKSDTSSGSLMFICPACFNKINGEKNDHILITKTYDNKGTYKNFIRGASSDPVNNKIIEPCPDCGRKYLTKIRIGGDEKTVKTCECGYAVSL